MEPVLCTDAVRGYFSLLLLLLPIICVLSESRPRALLLNVSCTNGGVLCSLGAASSHAKRRGAILRMLEEKHDAQLRSLRPMLPVFANSIPPLERANPCAATTW